MMRWTTFLVVLVTSDLLVAAMSEFSRFNILFVLVDDLGWKDLGSYGNRFIETPHADRLAAQGMRFTDAYAASPVCSPTRASLLTGQYPARIGMYEVIGLPPRPYAKMIPPPNAQELPASAVTFADILRKQGYACGSIGKWHVGRTPAEAGFVPPQRKITDPALKAIADRNPSKRIGQITAEAIQFIRANQNQPFLLWLNHYAVHAPLEAREDLIAKYRQKAAQTGVTNIAPTYAAMTEMADESLGLLLAELDNLKLSGRTVVIFTSDNGGLIQDMHLKQPTPLATCNLPLRSQKGDLYEGGIRVPLIVRWPGAVKAGSICRVPVSSPDLFATILDIAGAPLHADRPTDGSSLVPLLKQTGELNRKSLYWHFPTCMWSRWPGSAIRRGDHKLIEFHEDNRVELYNLATDIGESRDLAAQLPDVAKSLRAELAAWRNRIGAPMPQPNPNHDPARAALLPQQLTKVK